MSFDRKIVEKAYAEMQKKAAEDETFRKAMLANPNKAISEFIGQEIPADFRINVVEFDPSYQFTFLMPPTNELTDEELDTMAAGACWWNIDVCGAKAEGCAGQIAM